MERREVFKEGELLNMLVTSESSETNALDKLGSPVNISNSNNYDDSYSQERKHKTFLQRHLQSLIYP
jgi:hypothetical protein